MSAEPLFRFYAAEATDRRDSALRSLWFARRLDRSLQFARRLDRSLWFARPLHLSSNYIYPLTTSILYLGLLDLYIYPLSYRIHARFRSRLEC